MLKLQENKEIVDFWNNQKFIFPIIMFELKFFYLRNSKEVNAKKMHEHFSVRYSYLYIYIYK